MGGIRNKDNLFAAVFFGEFHRVRVFQRVNIQFRMNGMVHADRFCKRTDTDTQRTLDITFVQFQNQRCLAGNFLHQANDFVGKVSVMAAAEADNLHIFQMWISGSQNSSGQHAGMIIIDNIQSAHAQIHMVGFFQRICRQHRNAETCKHFRKVMVHKGIVLIRP